MEHMENLAMEEMAENAEAQAAEEIVEGEPGAKVEQPEKMYTEEELNNRVDELLSKKLKRREERIRREYEERYAPYREVESVLNAGLGTSNITEATQNLRKYYENQGVEIPKYQSPQYNEEDLRVLAESEARRVMESGMEEVIEEVDRLARKGVSNMSQREKLVFKSLAKYREAEEGKLELLKEGVKREVVESREFQEFAEQFDTKTPMKKVYELYRKTQEKPPAEKIGSLHNGNQNEDKKYYTPEEVDRMKPEDLDNPEIMKRVRESMFRWK